MCPAVHPRYTTAAGAAFSDEIYQARVETHSLKERSKVRETVKASVARDRQSLTDGYTSWSDMDVDSEANKRLSSYFISALSLTRHVMTSMKVWPDSHDSSDPCYSKFNFEQPAARPYPSPATLLRSSSVTFIAHPLVEQWETSAVAASHAVRKVHHNRA